MSTLEATATENVEKSVVEEVAFKVGLTKGNHEKLPAFSTALHRCDAPACGAASAALMFFTEENEHPLGFCGHHFREAKGKKNLNVDSLYALAVKEGEDDLKKIKGSRAGYLDT